MILVAKSSRDFALENNMIDSHCHINDRAFVGKEKEYVEDSKKEGVDTFLVVGCDLKTSKEAVRITKEFEGCYAAIGIHPSDSKHAGKNDLEEIEKLVSNNRVVAIGEIGLDFYWDKEENIKQDQREYFIKQIDLANKYNLPISIHCRDAYEECLNILKTHPVKKGGAMHCYSGSKEMMVNFLRLGFYIGIGGTVTFKNAVKVKEVAATVPSDRYLLETDSPYLAPTPHRGEQNHSKYIPLIAKQIAELRNVSVNQVEKETNENFKRLFNL